MDSRTSRGDGLCHSRGASSLISGEIKTLEGFEKTTLASFPERLLALAAKLYKRMLVRSRIDCVELMELHSDFTLLVFAPTSGPSGL